MSCRRQKPEKLTSYYIKSDAIKKGRTSFTALVGALCLRKKDASAAPILGHSKNPSRQIATTDVTLFADTVLTRPNSAAQSKIATPPSCWLDGVIWLRG
jgi:hypothetical protein